MIVRAAQRSDATTLAAFNAALARETEGRELDPQRLAAGVAAVLEDPGRGRYLVAEREGRPVGALLLTLEWSDWRAGWFWWIQSVYVAAPHRRRGVFRALHAHVLERARERADVLGLRLYVEAGNEVAQHAYARLGLRRTSYLLLERALAAGAVPSEETR
jgi:GNAT superfamily N-acetyltransferase